MDDAVYFAPEEVGFMIAVLSTSVHDHHPLWYNCITKLEKLLEPSQPKSADSSSSSSSSA